MSCSGQISQVKCVCRRVCRRRFVYVFRRCPHHLPDVFPADFVSQVRNTLDQGLSKVPAVKCIDLSVFTSKFISLCLPIRSLLVSVPPFTPMFVPSLIEHVKSNYLFCFFAVRSFCVGIFAECLCWGRGSLPWRVWRARAPPLRRVVIVRNVWRGLHSTLVARPFALKTKNNQKAEVSG